MVMLIVDGDQRHKFFSVPTSGTCAAICSCFCSPCWIAFQFQQVTVSTECCSQHKEGLVVMAVNAAHLFVALKGDEECE